jgi:hypothetical protein
MFKQADVIKYVDFRSAHEGMEIAFLDRDAVANCVFIFYVCYFDRSLRPSHA